MSRIKAGRNKPIGVSGGTSLPETLALIPAYLLNHNKKRRSGRECRNPEATDGFGVQIPVIWIPAFPAGMTNLT